MKKRLNQWISFMLTGLIGLLGFSSCDSINNRAVEYGAPSAKYILKGRVVDINTGEGIPDIQVRTHPIDRYGEYYEGHFYEIQTAEDGAFVLTTPIIHPQHEHKVFITDVDGPKNGSYLQLEKDADFTPHVVDKGKNWEYYVGTIDLGELKMLPVPGEEE